MSFVEVVVVVVVVCLCKPNCFLCCISREFYNVFNDDNFFLSFLGAGGGEGFLFLGTYTYAFPTSKNGC